MTFNRIADIQPALVPASTLYYFRTPSGVRQIFRRGEIRNIQQHLGKVVLTTVTGCQYVLTSLRPEQVQRETPA
jgi:hypothetical protein